MGWRVVVGRVRRRRWAKQEEFARLIAAGVSGLQACRMVGINPRTGKRWRHGRTVISRSGRRLHYPRVINAPVREISSRFLSEDERVTIADLHRRGRGVRAIARETASGSVPTRAASEPPYAVHDLRTRLLHHLQ